jgi:hypothetical protein
VSLVRDAAQAHTFEATLRELPADRYLARLTIPGAPLLTAAFQVKAPPTELSQLAVNSAGLSEAARTTDGKMFTASTVQQLADQLPPPRRKVIERLPAAPLWNSPWVLAALCVTLGVEWLVRRRAGLI